MYTLYVITISPYAMKSSAMIGYTQLPCCVRKATATKRYTVLRKYTGRTMVPVLNKGEWAINDSTKIACFLLNHSMRPLLPTNSAAALASWLLEDFADEWITRWAMYSRWCNDRDRDELIPIMGRELLGDVPVGAKYMGRAAYAGLRKNFVAMGLVPENRRAFQNSQQRCLHALEQILKTAPRFLFGDYPTVADFSIYGGLGQFARDVTGRQLIRDFPATLNYVRTLDALCLPLPEYHEPSSEYPRFLDVLKPLFAEFMGTYWQVLVANFFAYSNDRSKRKYVAEMIDGTTVSMPVSGYLIGRLKHILRLLNDAYAQRAEIFGTEGIMLEAALLTQIATLSQSSSGRELLRQYPHIAQL